VAAFLVPRRSAVVRWRGTLDGLLPAQHPARFIWQVLSSLDFAALEDRYRSVSGGPGCCRSRWMRSSRTDWMICIAER